MKSKKLTSDRIATLGSRMMKAVKGASRSQRLYLADHGDRVIGIWCGLTVGDIRDAGASLVSQADGPEVVTRKKVKG